MRYKIFGDMMPAVTIQLDQGESVYTQSGGMSWMTGGVKMDTNMRGGLGGAFGRIFPPLPAKRGKRGKTRKKEK